MEVTQAEAQIKKRAKKRFSFTATGKSAARAIREKHGMIKRSNKQVRNLRGTAIMDLADAKAVKKHFLP